MRKWFGFILLLGLMMFPSAAGAQNTIKFESLNVELWSEYDQPSMLVIVEFVVTPDTQVPATVTMRFPQGGNLVAVAIEQDGGLFNADFAGPEEQGNWQVIKIDVQTYDTHRIEYYLSLNRDGNKRGFEYQWFGDYAVKDLSVNILIPGDSVEIVSSPLLSSTSAANGAIIGSVSKNGLNAGQPYDFKLEYTRESDAVMNVGQSDGVQPSEPIGQDTPGRVSIDQMPYVIGGVGVILILIALFFYFRSTQVSETTPRRKRRPRSDDPSAEVGQAYCHECGARAHVGDRFCRTCGSRLRIGQ